VSNDTTTFRTHSNTESDNDEPDVVPVTEEEVQEYFPDFLLEEYPDGAQKILKSGIELFSRRGYAGTSVRDIVDRAGVTNPMVYYYFNSKQGLFEAILDCLFKLLSERLEHELTDVDTVRGQVQSAFETYFETCLDYPDLIRFEYMVMFGPDQATPGINVEAARKDFRRTLDEMFRSALQSETFQPHEGLERDFLVDELSGMINHYAIRLLRRLDTAETDGDRDQVVQEMVSEERLERLADFFFNGAGELSD
jgi:AcrR family transcriptional regulator